MKTTAASSLLAGGVPHSNPATSSPGAGYYWRIDASNVWVWTQGYSSAEVDTAVAAKVAKTGDTMTGALGLTAGTVAAPAINFGGDTDTGIYSIGADIIGIAVGGVEAVRIIESAGAITTVLAGTLKSDTIRNTTGANNSGTIGASGQAFARADIDEIAAGYINASSYLRAPTLFASSPSGNSYAYFNSSSPGSASFISFQQDGATYGILQAYATSDLYYDFNQHIFRSAAGANYATLNSSGLSVTGLGSFTGGGTFGAVANVGAWPAGPIYAMFRHANLSGVDAGNYALLQGAAGDTFLNAATGEKVRIGVNNGQQVQVSSTVVTSSLPIEVAGSGSFTTASGNKQLELIHSNAAGEAAVQVTCGTANGIFKTFGSSHTYAELTGKVAVASDGTSAGLVLMTNGSVSDGGTGTISFRPGGYAAPAERLLMSKDLSTFTGPVTVTGPVSIGPYTFATLPSASANSGKLLRITDRGQKHAYSDGTDWRFVGDDAIVS